MTLQFDHIVHYVENPQQAIKQFEEHGLHAVEGGKHEGRGTYNALSYFDLSYIEFLSTYDKELIEQVKHPSFSLFHSVVTNKYKEGFIRVAIRTTAIEELAKKFEAEGLEVHGPVPLSRQRPDGSVIAWKLLYVGEAASELQFPFFIQWNESDGERRNDLIDRGVIEINEVTQAFSKIAFAVRDAEKTASTWAKWMGLTIKARYKDEDLCANCVQVELEGGDLLFCEPFADGPVQQTLDIEGEKPFRVEITNSKENKLLTVLNGQYELTI